MANSARFLPFGVRRILMVLLLALLGTPCFAGTFTAFGPQVYVRGTGTPVTVTNTFTILNPNTQYTLRVRNGGLVDDTTDRVSSTTVTVNGVIVVAPNDLNQNIAEVDKPVTLLASNQIDVQVRGAPGGTLSIDILGIDNDPPVITADVNPLVNPGGWNNTSVVVTFTCRDATSGIATCPAPATVSTDGANQVISGQAVDKAGNTASTSVTLQIDRTPPTISASANPAPNAAGWNNTDVTISYVCADALSGVVSCPDPALVSTEGRAQQITESATDRATNSASATTLVNLDKTPPVVSITSPVAGVVVNTSSITVGGTVNDALSGVASVKCGGTAATLSGSSFSCSQSLVPGTNAIQIQALDIAGNSIFTSTSVAYVKPPQITITSPVNSALFNQSPINVTGTVVDPAAHVLVNGLTAPVSGNSFLATVPAQEGISTITAVVTNSDGSTDTASVQINLDTTPPHLAIYAPLDGSVTPDGSVTVTGLVNDIVVGTVNPQQATVKVNGVDAQVANRSFSVSNIPLAVGPNLIHATAVDAAGNQATTTVTVVRQAPGQPAVKVFSGNNQSGTIGTQLAQPLVAQVVNASGQPVANVPVVFRVTAQDGKLGPTNPGLSDIAVNTDVQGLASVPFTLGSHAGAGNNLVEASTTGVPATAVFSASAVSSGATLINVDSGNNQFGVVGQALPLPFIAVVTDAGHNRIPGVPVTFTVRQGAGNVNGQSSVTLNSDGDGRVQAVLTLGPDAGTNNNLLEATFPGNTAFPAAFTATGRTQGPAAATAISGVVLDNSNQPIPGVTMRLFQLNQGPSGNLPQQVGTPVVTDGEGQFSIQPAPVGVFKLMADGGTATRPGVWPTLEYDIITTPGQNNTVGSPIYLPQLNPDNKLCVTPSTGGTLTVPQVPGFSLTIAPGSATFPGGSHTGCVTVTPVNMDKVPMVPGFGQQPRFVVTIQPVGTMFNPPAAMTIPNVDGLAPRAVTEMYSYDHDLASFVAIGTATVSDDGSVIRSDPGVGVLKAGWHCGGDPNSTGSAGTCPTCNKCSGSSCVADDTQVPPEKCKACKNGQVVEKDLGDFKDKITVGANADLPDVLKLGLQNAINKIPGVSAQIESLKLGVTEKVKDCCDPATGNTVPEGKTETTVNIQATIRNLNVQIWPLPPTMIDKTFSASAFGQIVEVRILFLAGVFIRSDLTFGGEGGLRTDACGTENCAFGGLTAGVNIGLAVEVSAQGCFDSTFTGQSCTPTLDVTVAPLVLSIEGHAGFNEAKCDEGLSGFVKVLGVKFSVDFKLPLLPTFTFEREIFGGFCALGTCPP
jgi:glucodextranase-like protein